VSVLCDINCCHAFSDEELYGQSADKLIAVDVLHGYLRTFTLPSLLLLLPLHLTCLYLYYIYLYVYFQVTLLLQCFSDAELADESTDKQTSVDFIHLYNRRFSGQPLSVSNTAFPFLLAYSKRLKVLYSFL